MTEANRDIYPWYEGPRWFDEVFIKDPAVGRQVLRRHSFAGTRVYFRRRYASLRLNGFEYARLDDNGSFRYGQKNRRLNPAACPPGELVASLGRMFGKLAESGGDFRTIPAWANATFRPELAGFIAYAAENHQPEHWLESMLLPQVPALCETYESSRSQVVVGDVGKRGWKFIDILLLDRHHRELVVLELKVPQANGSAVGQVAEYAHWVADNKVRLLNPAYGYFPEVGQPAEFRISVAFVAPAFATNFAGYVRAHLAGFPTRLFVAKGEWRKGIKIREARLSEFACEKGVHVSGITDGESSSATGVSLGHGRDGLRHRLLKEAGAAGLQLRRIWRFEYDDLDNSSGEVVTQIHSDNQQTCGLVLVRARKDCEGLIRVLKPWPIGDRKLSGDRGPNRNWLRGDKPYQDKGPAGIYWVPVGMAEDESHPGWEDVRQILRPATW